jgi:hypothetical protein
MAGIEEIVRDEENGRICVHWSMGGITFRNNIVNKGGCIPQHVHEQDHPYIVHGWGDLRTVSPSGEVEEYQVAGLEFKTDDPDFNPRGHLFNVPAGYQHTFTPRSDNFSVLCMWPG